MAEYHPRDKHTEPTQSSIPARRVTSEEVAYRDGYVHGRAVENRRHDPLHPEQSDLLHTTEQQRALDRRERQLRTEADNYIASGLVLGLFISLLVGLIGGLMYFLTRQAETETVVEPEVEQVVPAVEPVQTSPDANIPDVNIVVPTPEEAPTNDVDTQNGVVDTAPEGTVPDEATTDGTAPNPTTVPRATTESPTENAPNNLEADPPEQLVPLGVQQLPADQTDQGEETSQ